MTPYTGIIALNRKEKRGIEVEPGCTKFRTGKLESR